MLARLCRKFGAPYIHPDYLAAALTERQLQFWELVWEIEPWDTPAADERAALIAWSNITPHATGTKPPISDFMLQHGPKDPPTPAEYRAKHRAIMNRASGAGNLFDE